MTSNHWPWSQKINIMALDYVCKNHPLLIMFTCYCSSSKVRSLIEEVKTKEVEKKSCRAQYESQCEELKSTIHSLQMEMKVKVIKIILFLSLQSVKFIHNMWSSHKAWLAFSPESQWVHCVVNLLVVAWMLNLVTKLRFKDVDIKIMDFNMNLDDEL